MTSALIGHTGFVGRTLARSGDFDALINSKNTDDLRNGDFDLVVCAAVSAVKWLANREPARDRAEIDGLRSVLTTVKAREFVLISTIDVYPDPSSPLDETTAPDPSANHAYGRHRLEFERWIQAQFETTRIVRLGALFGDGLKKNIVYDLLHHNMTTSINPASVFQWYPMERLNRDIERIREADLRMVNLFPQGLRTSAILQAFFPEAQTAAESHPAPVYDLRTKHAGHFGGQSGYIMDSAAVLEAMGRFVAAERCRS